MTQQRHPKVLIISKKSLDLRVYPRSLGDRLVKLYEEFAHLPRRDLRCKVPVDPSHTDRELFKNMKNDDLWLDADLPSVLFYIAENKHVAIPPSWQRTMDENIEEVRKEVFKLSI